MVSVNCRLQISICASRVCDFKGAEKILTFVFYNKCKFIPSCKLAASRVGAEIIAHGIPFTTHILHDIDVALTDFPVLAWLSKALACALGGLLVGFIVEKLVILFKMVFYKKKESLSN